jgi:ABC-2 type transport system ATP-binding protein
MSTPKPLIALENITKKYRDTLALDQVSFEINEGEVFGYIGPNGAGKTTTIKILVGLISEFQGSLRIGGHHMPDERDKVNPLLGYMPQDVAFQEWRTVDHALTTFALLSGIKKAELDRGIQASLEIVGLAKERHKKVVHLSGGMVQKLGFAQALLHRPRLLVLDEPLSGLDPESRHQIKEVMRNLGRDGTTVFFSSHILSDVQDIASRIGIIHRGKILQIGTLTELKSHLDVTNDYTIVLSSDTGCWSEVRSLKGVEGIESAGPGKLLLHIGINAAADEVIDGAIRKLLEGGSRIRSIAPASQSLDEVYLRYVGGAGKA